MKMETYGEDRRGGAAERSEESRAEDGEEDQEEGGDRSSLQRRMVGERILHRRRRTGTPTGFVARNPNASFHELSRRRRSKKKKKRRERSLSFLSAWGICPGVRYVGGAVAFIALLQVVCGYHSDKSWVKGVKLRRGPHIKKKF